jgi:hypothetical protein
MLPNLSFGSKGSDVLAVQDALNLTPQTKDPTIDGKGVFGSATDTAVRRFQTRKKLVPDGVVGPRTRAALFPLGTVTVRAVGMRLRMPSFSTRAALQSQFGPGPLTLDSNPQPRPSPLTLPSLVPSFAYQPVRYPKLSMPIAAPPLAPPSFPSLTLPVDHFEIQPGGSVSAGKSLDVAFSLTLSGVVMIGPANARHQEFSSGLLMSTPGVFSGGDWTVAWFAQLTHVEQLARFGNFSWQPNAQLVAANSFRPSIALSVSPANVQFDANNLLSVSVGGPSFTSTFSPDSATLTWSLASVGLVAKF